MSPFEKFWSRLALAMSVKGLKGDGFQRERIALGYNVFPVVSKKCVSVVTSLINKYKTTRSLRGQPSALPAAFCRIFAGNGAESAGLLKETSASPRADPSFSESLF